MTGLNLRRRLPAAQPQAFFGGWVVAGCFIMATAAWGLGFYGNGVYLAHLVRDLGWPVGQVAPALSVYFWIGAVLLVATGRLVDHIGPQRSASLGMLAMTLAVLAIARVQTVWQFYAALTLLALGWSWMSGAAINTTLSRWFDARRGTAVSLALTGASMGGILVVPLMVAAIERWGFRDGLSLIALGLALPVIGAAWFCFVREPALLGQQADGPGAPVVRGQDRADAAAPRLWSIGRLLRERAFVSNVMPFSLGLLAQAGLLMHQVTMLSERHGVRHAAWGVVLTTLAAMAGRLLMGHLADRAPRRALAALNFSIQVIGLLLFAFTQDLASMYLACVFYGVAVGNMIALPGLLVQREFPREQFAHVTRWATAINQFVYALGPGLLGLLRERSGNYFSCLLLCTLVGMGCAALVWLGRPKGVAGTAARPPG